MGEFCPLSKTFSSKCLQGQNLWFFTLKASKMPVSHENVRSQHAFLGALEINLS